MPDRERRVAISPNAKGNNNAGQLVIEIATGLWHTAAMFVPLPAAMAVAATSAAGQSC